MATLNSAALPPRVVDGRRASRTRTLLGGKLIYGEHHYTCDCSIRDISESGARITLPKGQVIPTRIFLMDRSTASAYEARVAWIKVPDFGLGFVKAYNLEGELPPELQFLKRIWAMFRSPLGSTPDGIFSGG
jgi:hypothetical protein